MTRSWSLRNLGFLDADISNSRGLDQSRTTYRIEHYSIVKKLSFSLSVWQMFIWLLLEEEPGSLFGHKTWPLELMKMTKSQSWVMKKLRIMCVNPHQLFVKKTLSDSVLFFCNDGEKWHFHKFQRNIHLPIPLSENVIRRVEFSIICTAVFCGIFNFNLLKEEK